MSAKEEIEAAAKRYADSNYPTHCHGNIEEWDEYWQPIQFADDQRLLAKVAIAEWQQRERDQQPPTREMFERLKLMHLFNCASIAGEHSEDWTTWCGHAFARFDTIAKLRAACLLLGIDTEGVL